MNEEQHPILNRTKLRHRLARLLKAYYESLFALPPGHDDWLKGDEQKAKTKTDPLAEKEGARRA